MLEGYLGFIKCNQNVSRMTKVVAKKQRFGVHVVILGPKPYVWLFGLYRLSIYKYLFLLGVCDPMDSALCQNNNHWDVCKVTDSKCAAINEPGKN